MILKRFMTILLLFFSTFAFANSLVIDKNLESFLVKDFLIYEDKEKSQDIESILKNKNIFKKAKKII